MRFKLRIDMMKCVFEKDCSGDIVEEGFGEVVTPGDRGQVKVLTQSREPVMSSEYPRTGKCEDVRWMRVYTRWYKEKGDF